jgi:hypothetical protein
VNFNIKIIITIIILAILALSSYFVFYYSNNENKDTEPPVIDTISGDLNCKNGDTITIFTEFSDNINVTNATLYYKTSSEINWNSKSILSGNASILINSKEDVFYFVTIDDAEGNGPVGDPSINGSVYYTIIVRDDTEDDEFIHTVFIEEASFTDCYYCPLVAGMLYDLFSSGNYNFYYVTLIKTVEKAISRLDNEYKLYGLPTVYVDGGYKVLVGGLHKKSEYAQAIRDAEVRVVPKIKVTIDSKYNNITNNLENNIVIINKENETYDGRLRVYLTEKVSRWSGPEGEPYHFGFLDFIINEDISVGANDNVSFIETRDLSDLDPENLMVIAAVFNSEKHQRYSNPPKGNPFNAYFTDAVDGAEVVEGGNLPPVVSIIRPTFSKWHILGKPITKTLRQNTIIIGKTTIGVNATDDNKIEKVEFYIDGILKNTKTEKPYEWTFRKIGIFRNIIRQNSIQVIAYDDEGKTAQDNLVVLSLFL